MSITNEIFMLKRELNQITLDYYWAPFSVKPQILKEIALFQNAIQLLLKQ